jgi:hypothetical protein
VQIFVKAIEASLPEPPVVFYPIGRVFERAGFELAGPPLSLAAAADQPCVFQNLEVLRYGRWSNRKRLGEILNR